jgi:polysaccharide export outer membrane protein
MLRSGNPGAFISGNLMSFADRTSIRRFLTALPSVTRGPSGGVPARFVLALLAAAALSSCAPRGDYVWAQDLPAEAGNAAPQLPSGPLKAGDRIYVFVANQSALTAEHVIAEDGSIPLPLAGRVVAVGLTADALARKIEDRLRGMLEAPQVAVSVLLRRPALVTVVGEVRTPGAVEVRPELGVIDALARAGGLTDFAHQKHIYVVRRGPTPLRVRFDYRDLKTGDPLANRFALADGDVIVVE